MCRVQDKDKEKEKEKDKEPAARKRDLRFDRALLLLQVLPPRLRHDASLFAAVVVVLHASHTRSPVVDTDVAANSVRLRASHVASSTASRVTGTVTSTY